MSYLCFVGQFKSQQNVTNNIGHTMNNSLEIYVWFMPAYVRWKSVKMIVKYNHENILIYCVCMRGVQ